jgi:hypothetical protein
MTYAVVCDVPASWDHYSVVAAALEGEAPEGLVVHVAGPTDEGFRMIDVWESEAAWLRFRADRLAPLSEGLLHPPIARALELAHVVVVGNRAP